MRRKPLENQSPHQVEHPIPPEKKKLEGGARLALQKLRHGLHVKCHERIVEKSGPKMLKRHSIDIMVVVVVMI